MARGYGNAEAVVYNFGPLANYQLQHAAQMRAENALLDKQVATDLAKLTPEGIRPQDMPQFLKQYQDLKNMTITNREALRNPAKNPKVYQEWLDARAAIQSTIAESKGAKEMNKQAYSFYTKNAGKIDQDAFRQAASLFNAPIGTPEFEKGKGYDITQAIFKPEQFDQGKWQTFLNAAVKPVDRVTSEELATGQHRNVKIRYTDPAALRNVVGQAYDNDLQHSRKFYDSQYEKVDEASKSELEGYTQKYIPDFKINSGKDFAVAANLYGQVEKNMGETVTGSAWKANQAFQREQQARSFAQAEKMDQKRLDRKDDNFYLVDKIAADIKNGDIPTAIEPLKAIATPGVEILYLRSGHTPKHTIADVKNAMTHQDNAVDVETRTVTDKDINDGVIVVAVPKIDKTTKQIIKGQYDYMALKRGQGNYQPRINQLLNFSRGGAIKPLPDKYYKQTAIGTMPTLDFTPGSLDDPEEDNTQDEN